MNSKANASKENWTYEDELCLLNAVDSCGFGNWTVISERVPPYSPSECEKHYFDTYCNDFKENMNMIPLCPNNCKIKLKRNRAYSFNYIEVLKMNTYLKNLENNENSSKDIQPETRSSNIYSFNMLGMPSSEFNRIRSDFDVEYDNGAESILKMIGNSGLDKSEMTKKESHFFDEVAYSYCRTYNARLKKRLKRKKIIRNHCLLDKRKTFSMLQRLDVAFGSTSMKALLPCLRYFNGPEFDMLIELLKYQIELELECSMLAECRKSGLRYMSEAKIFKESQKKRLKYEAELSSFRLPVNGEIRSSVSQSSRKPIRPLAIGHLPGYNLLNEEERGLCSLSRIVPETYNTFKEVLMAECKKHNGLRLAQARNLIKIDVNKTRKIYDHLMSANLIWQPEA